jgi:hypothetical protein
VRAVLIHAVTIAALAGCPTDDGRKLTLYLAPDLVETEVKLIEQEPPPF